MSVVTGLVLMCSLADGECDGDEGLPSENIANLNRWLAARGFQPLLNVSSESGGSKHPQCCVFVCGYNYFPEIDFVKFVQSLEWRDRDNLVLAMQPEDGPTQTWR